MKYELHVYCRHGKGTGDAGLHAQYECADDDEAKSRVGPDLTFLRACYDTVQWSLLPVGGGEAIAKGTAYGHR